MAINSIKEFREQYPQYDRLSDEQVADNLYSHYGNRMSREDFDKRLGYSSSKQEEPSILQQIGQEAKAFAQNPVESFKQAGKDIFGSANQALGNAGIYGYNTLNKLNRIPQMNVNPLSGANTDSLGGIIGGALGAGGGFAGPEMLAARGISLLPRIAGAMTPIAKSILGVAAPAAIGAAESPEGERGFGAFAGGIIPSGQAALRGGENALTGLLGKFGKASPQEANAAAQMAGEAPVGLGDILQSPGLQAVQKGIANVPLSGVAKTQGKVADIAQEHANNLSEGLKGGIAAEDIPDNISNAITVNKVNKGEISTKLYDQVADAADKLTTNSAPIKESEIFGKSGVSRKKATYFAEGRPALLEDLAKTKKNIEPFLKEHESGLTLLPENIQKKLEELKNYNSENGITYAEANGLMKEFKEAARNNSSKDKYAAKIYGHVANGLRNDIEENAKRLGDTNLTRAINDASSFYKHEYVPYQGNIAIKSENGKLNLDAIHNNLLKNTDEANKLVEDLPSDVQKLILHMKTQAAQNDPAAMYKIYSKLTPSQKQKLLSPQEQKEWEKLGFLAKQAKSSGNEKIRHVLGGMELAGGALSILHNPLLAGSLLGGTAAARGINKLLTSPSIRNSVLGKSSRYENEPLNALLKSGIAGNLLNQNQQVNQ